MGLVYIDLVSYDPEYYGGVGTYVRGIVPELIDTNQNEEITLIFTDINEDAIRELGVGNCKLLRANPSHLNLIASLYKINYRVLGWVWLLSLTQFLHWRNLVKELKGQECVIYTPTTYINFRVKTAKHVVSLHDTQEKAFPNYFTSTQKRYRNTNVINTLKSISVLQSSSQFIRSEIFNFYGKYLKNKEAIIIPEGVRSSIQHPISVGLEKGLNLFCPASLSQHKRQDLLLNSVLSLDKNVVRTVHLTGDWNNDFGKRLRDMFIEDSRVNFHGYVDKTELISIYQKSDAVISCSEYESSSLPILEGASYGKILIASDIDAHIEMGKYFRIFYFATGSVESLCQTLNGIVLLSREELDEILRTNQAAARALSWTAVATNYWKLFIDLTV
jgi:glycosyltransferase involved in cell wall biosynthesis